MQQGFRHLRVVHKFEQLDVEFRAARSVAEPVQDRQDLLGTGNVGEIGQQLGSLGVHDHFRKPTPGFPRHLLRLAERQAGEHILLGPVEKFFVEEMSKFRHLPDHVEGKPLVMLHGGGDGAYSLGDFREIAGERRVGFVAPFWGERPRVIEWALETDLQMVAPDPVLVQRFPGWNDLP